MSTEQHIPTTPVSSPAKSYLNDPPGLRSWLLTRDHKRIGLRFLVLIAASLALGATFALLIRTELAIPGPTLVSSGHAYNRLLAPHGDAAGRGLARQGDQRIGIPLAIGHLKAQMRARGERGQRRAVDGAQNQFPNGIGNLGGGDDLKRDGLRGIARLAGVRHRVILPVRMTGRFPACGSLP